jgi:broad specificity phosphatase PhoE
MKPGVTLYVVRHGETDWNVAGRLQGQTDIPLNDVGRAQAAKNGRRLSHQNLDPKLVDFVASPLSRAYETMELMRQAMGLPRDGFRTDPRLRELSYGRCEGRTWSQLPPFDAHGVRRSDDFFNWLPEGGESYAHAMQRTAGWLAEIERDTVVVTHGGITRTLRGLVVGIATHKVPSLKVPQDRVLVLRDNTMSWL